MIKRMPPQKWAIKGLILLAIFIAILVAFTMTRGSAASEEVPTPSNVAFDHSGCQYPARLSNPVDGCDNSDPPCGEVAKGAEKCPADGEAVAIEGSSDLPMSQNTEPVHKPVETVHKCE